MVVGELERRWNERLMEVARLEAEIQAAREIHPEIAISEAERTELTALAEDLPRAWNHPAASAETRKRILRAVLEEIIVKVEPAHLHLKLHWKGGEHTSLEVPEEPSWRAPMEDQRGNRATDPRSRSATAGCQHRRRSESAERTFGKRTYLDPAARSKLPSRTGNRDLPHRRAC